MKSLMTIISLLLAFQGVADASYLCKNMKFAYAYRLSESPATEWPVFDFVPIAPDLDPEFTANTINECITHFRNSIGTDQNCRDAVSFWCTQRRGNKTCLTAAGRELMATTQFFFHGHWQVVYPNGSIHESGFDAQCK